MSSPLKGWNILVVDDEPDSLFVAQYILTYHGAAVHTAIDGQEGYNVALEVRPKLIIADLSMPEVDGWTMLQMLKGNDITRIIPIIALTAHAMVGDRERALAAGFDNYLSKPLTVETFLRDLMRLLKDIPILAELLNSGLDEE
ncbi:MAG: response regulator [Anaerolineales bacterium]|nr:response regulator [Anaerolineales bacterium]